MCEPEHWYSPLAKRNGMTDAERLLLLKISHLIEEQREILLARAKGASHKSTSSSPVLAA